MIKFNSQNIKQYKMPFHFLKCEDFLDSYQAKCILDWFEKNDHLWHLTRADFYTQYEFSLNQKNVPADMSFIIAPSTLSSLKELMSKYYQCSFENNIDIVAHKLVEGHVIKIHNDYLEQQEIDFTPETHRLLIQINSDWNEEKGGFLLLFNSDNPHDLHDALLPSNRSMFSFEISPNSHHAVSRINHGSRYTLIYNFYRKMSD